MTREEHSIARNNVAGLEGLDIARDDIVYVNQLFSTIADDFDGMFFSLLVETLKLLFLLPVI